MSLGGTIMAESPTTPKTDRERSIWDAGYQRGRDDAFREKLRRPEAGAVFRDSLSLRGEVTDERGKEHYQSMLVVHASVHDEQMMSVSITGNHNIYDMTIDEAVKLAEWLTKRTSPSGLRMPSKKTKPKGLANG
jgi:hypothetical protein